MSPSGEGDIFVGFTAVVVVCFFWRACISSTKDKVRVSDDLVSEPTASSDEVLIAKDTLKDNQQSLDPDPNQLSREGSSLTSEISNLNMDIRFSADQLFDFDKAVLKPEAEGVLNQVAADLRRTGTESVVITGHTDAKGDKDYNKKLSERRAKSVKDWFVRNGLKNKFMTEGKGEEEPIAPNTTDEGKDSEEGRAKNRRVEIKYLGTETIGK